MMHTYKQIDFSDYDSVFDDLLLDVPRTSLLQNKASNIVTMGSCFAGNIANSLCLYGYQASPITISEHLNTPLVNKLFMDFIAEGGQSENAHAIAILLNNQRKNNISINDLYQKAAQKIHTADLFILTLGVGFLWQNKKGEICMSIDGTKISEYAPVFPSSDQQCGLLNKVVNQLRYINPYIPIFITVSPVPLNICTAPRSQIIADCLSKSILRIAAQQMVDKHKDVHYFPSFEFFRWASGHSDRAFFGADGVVRHPDVDLVNLVVSKFIEINGGAFTQNSINQQEKVA